MKLTVLGCYGPFPKVGGATSSYLFSVSDKKFILDFGAGAFSRLLEKEKPENIDAIILSHLHFDHISDIGVLSYYFQGLFNGGYQKKLTVIMPEDETNDIFKISASPYFNVIKIKEGEMLNFGDVTLQFYKMRHPVLSYGVKVFAEGKTFAYTGDTNVCENVEKLFLSSDLVLADGAFTKDDWAENKPHLSVGYIADLTKKCGNKSIITHLNPKYTLEELNLEMKDANCEIAEIGKCYEL